MVNTCPYLDTVNRTVLDFDSTRTCSRTLESSPHIYACLVCGRFFRGRGRHTPAYTHSVEEEGGHFVFLHLTEGTFWCLPDGYEVPRDEPSLADIGRALRPVFSRGEVARLDENRVRFFDFASGLVCRLGFDLSKQGLDPLNTPAYFRNWRGTYSGVGISRGSWG